MAVRLGAIGSARLLTIEDAMALKQSRYAQYTNASVVGNAEIRAQGRSRRVTAYGQGPDFARAFNMQVETGQFLPDDDPRNPRAYACSVPKCAPNCSATPIRSARCCKSAGSRFRVIGVMASKGNVHRF
jgi:putative ABC transport system permease protein